MSKRRDCPIRIAAETDARFYLLPITCRWIWMQLVRLAEANSTSVIRFGSAVPSLTQLATMLGLTEAELEGSLPSLLRTGLLVQEADGALAAPFLRSILTRSEINRANGLKGGRPRKSTAPPSRLRLVSEGVKP